MSNPQQSAQGSITIRRLRNGDSLFISLDTNGIPLYQGVDTTAGSVSPDWTQPANQPVLTPKATTAKGAAVVLSGHQWEYNGSSILFTGATSGDWQTDSTGKFQLNTSTGALRIIANLANPAAVANASLVYRGTATTGGVNYSVSRGTDIVIQAMGASSYYGAVTASVSTLDSSTQNSTVKAVLYVGGAAVPSFHVKWYKDTVAWPANDGQQSITVGRNDVDGTQLFIAEFYLSASDTTPVARGGIYIIDSLDEYIIRLTITSTAKEVAPGQDVTVKAEVYNTTKNQVETLASPTWALNVMEKDTWTSLKSSTTDTITVTTAETDRNQRENDVEVVAEVSF